MNGNPNLHLVLLLKLLGVAIIVLGTSVSVWDVLDLPSASNLGLLNFFPTPNLAGFLLGRVPRGGGYELRFILHGLLASLQAGVFIIVAAEIADRLGWERTAEAAPLAAADLPLPPVAPSS